MKILENLKNYFKDCFKSYFIDLSHNLSIDVIENIAPVEQLVELKIYTSECGQDYWFARLLDSQATEQLANQLKSFTVLYINSLEIIKDLPIKNWVMSWVNIRCCKTRNREMLKTE